MKRAIFLGLVVLVCHIVSGLLFAQIDSKYNDPDTPKIRASFTVVPDTNDIKELREFIMNCNKNWSPQMMNRYKDYEDYELFLNEKAQAELDAAEKILSIVQGQGREENTNADDDAARKYFIFGERPEDNDTTFAIKVQIISYYQLRDKTTESLDRFERFVESLERDPKRKDLGVHARVYWFNANNYFALFAADVSHFNKTFDQLKTYLAANTDNPLLKYYVTFLFSIHKQCAEGIESSPKTSVKKGTLVVPMFEYYDTIYRSWDEDFAKQDGYGQNWANYYEGEMVKYRILAADDPMAAFREAVKKLKKSLEQELDKDSIQKVWALSAITEDLEQRTETQRLLYQTIRPIFAASSDSEVNDYAIGFDVILHQLALDGEELEFEAVLLDGTKIDLKDYRGKVVLLDYWATWCGPCIGEFPILKQIYKGWHDKGFEIIALSVDEDLDALKAMIKKEELPWLNTSEKLSKEQNLPDSREKYKINSYPTSILIGKDGKVVRADAQGYILSQELQKLLADNQESQ